MSYTFITDKGGSPPPIFNPSRLERHLAPHNCRAAAVLDIVRSIIHQGCDPIEQTRKAINRHQPHQAAHILHTLKGSVVNLGGMRVCELANELEWALENETAGAAVPPLLECIEREWQLFLREAERWLHEQETRLTPTLEARHTLNKLQIQQLKQYLFENNLKACDLFDELEGKMRECLDEATVDAIASAIAVLQYDRALELLSPTVARFEH